MIPIPKTAYPVVRVFKRDRIELPPADEWESTGPGGTKMFFRHGDNSKCPMGFHPMASDPAPSLNQFQIEFRYTEEWTIAVYHFANWWDEQTDVAEALSEIERVKGVVA